MPNKKPNFLNLSIKKKLIRLINKSKGIHGHLGPYLVIGIRMGLIGMREIGIIKNNAKLRVKVKILYNIPFSCSLDGIQVTTKCTIGNQKLSFEQTNFPDITSLFYLIDSEEGIRIKLKEKIIKYLEKELIKGDTKKQKELAMEISDMSEEKLFDMKNINSLEDQEI